MQLYIYLYNVFVCIFNFFIFKNSYRMQGNTICWVPGMDHAGIGTQMVVERDLMQKHTNEMKSSKHFDYNYNVRSVFGREKFLQEVWNWKHK